MAIGNLVQKEGRYEFTQFNYDWCSPMYRYRTGYSLVFYSRYEYWYDGRLFLIGNFSADDFAMIEAETGATAVNRQDFKKKPTVKMLIEKFEEKIKQSGKSIHEVIRDFKSKNLDLELWFVSSLII